ncbi:MAG TPA: macro domain-containing protein [Rhodanobacteraceae bacterium]
MSIAVVHGDITRIPADALVNAAAPALLGGGGVDGAIHRRAGRALLQACRQLPEVRPGVRCPTGEARVTPGFDLPVRYVIHTVGPVWRGGSHGEALLLGACYRHCLDLARVLGVERIVFPAISCGVYGYPHAEAAHVAVESLVEAMAEHAMRSFDVLLCGYTEAMVKILRQAVQDVATRPCNSPLGN